MSKSNSMERLELSLVRLQDLLADHKAVASAKFGMNKSDLAILTLLHYTGDKKMKDISANVRTKLSNLTNLVDALESRKLAKRTPSKIDRRSVDVSITAKGEKLYADYLGSVRDLSKAMKRAAGKDFEGMVDGLEAVAGMES